MRCPVLSMISLTVIQGLGQRPRGEYSLITNSTAANLKCQRRQINLTLPVANEAWYLHCCAMYEGRDQWVIFSSLGSAMILI